MKNNTFNRGILVIPYAVFLVLFVLFPLFTVFYYGFTDKEGHISFRYFIEFFMNSRTMGTLFYSLVIAVATTLVCLMIAYPLAYILSKGEFSKRHSLLMVFVLPMWINFTLRITALKEILTILEGNLAYHPFLNTIIGMTYDFLPFMILPIYNSIQRVDDSLLEAGKDLGANGLETIFRILVPLSVPGIVSGVTMVFLPAMTNYVVLDMVYNSTYIMGSLIGSYFSSFDWNNGSLVSANLLILIGICTIVTNRILEGKERRDGI